MYLKPEPWGKDLSQIMAMTLPIAAYDGSGAPLMIIQLQNSWECWKMLDMRD